MGCSSFRISSRVPAAVVVSVVFVLSATAASPAYSQNDLINLKNGRSVRGTYEKSTPQQITLKTTDSSVTVDPWNIRRLRFGDEGTQITRAKTGYADERYNVCLDVLNGLEQPPSRDIVKQEVDYYRAMASAKTSLAGGGISANQAATLLDKFVTDNPNSFHYIPAVDALGDLAMEVGRFDVASKNFETVAASRWPELSFQSVLKNGRALMMQQKYTEAIAEFEKVEKADRSEDFALKSKLIAKCLRAQALGLSGQPDEGIKLAESVISKESSDNQSAFAYAYNALGACYKQKEDWKQAVHAYLHTDLLFFTEPQAHAEALYELQGIWRQLNRGDRASEARQKIKNRYRNTFWASKDG